MRIKQIKLTGAVVWLAAAIVVGVLTGVQSTGGLTLLAAFALVPPLVLMFLWHEPQETMSESIQGGRR